MESIVNEKEEKISEEDEKIIDLSENGRRIHEKDVLMTLSKMSLATRSIIWELEPADINYIDSILKKEVDGKKILTKRELKKELLKEIYKKEE